MSEHEIQKMKRSLQISTLNEREPHPHPCPLQVGGSHLTRMGWPRVGKHSCELRGSLWESSSAPQARLLSPNLIPLCLTVPLYPGVLGQGQTGGVVALAPWATWLPFAARQKAVLVSGEARARG